MQEEIDKISLKLDYLKSKRKIEDYKFTNQKTIENFLFSLELIKPDSRRQIVIDNINAFLDHSIQLEFPTTEEYVELYNSYIRPTGWIFTTKLNFTFLTPTKYLIPIFALPIILFFSLKPPVWALLLYLILAFIFINPFRIFKKDNKCWGIFY